MTLLILDETDRDVYILKEQIFLRLVMVGSIWDNVSSQAYKIYNMGLVVFTYFNAEIVHILPLST